VGAGPEDLNLRQPGKAARESGKNKKRGDILTMLLYRPISL
jgi:hypothetical protein